MVKIYAKVKRLQNRRCFFYGLFLASKLKYVLTFDDFGIIQQHMTFKGFNDSKRHLHWSQYFDMLEDKNISALLPRSWKKSFDNGITMPVKMKRCNECKGEILCDDFNNQVNEKKKFKTSLNFLKRDVPNQSGHMLPYYKKLY